MFIKHGIFIVQLIFLDLLGVPHPLVRSYFPDSAQLFNLAGHITHVAHTI
jgi:hypothetical protein